MDLFLSLDELTHIRIIGGQTEGPLVPKLTDRLCSIGMIEPTLGGWQLTAEGLLAISEADIA